MTVRCPKCHIEFHAATGHLLGGGVAWENCPRCKYQFDGCRAGNGLRTSSDTAASTFV